MIKYGALSYTRRAPSPRSEDHPSRLQRPANRRDDETYKKLETQTVFYYSNYPTRYFGDDAVSLSSEIEMCAEEIGSMQ